MEKKTFHFYGHVLYIVKSVGLRKKWPYKTGDLLIEVQIL
jgi:hypothetical protein